LGERFPRIPCPRGRTRKGHNGCIASTYFDAILDANLQKFV